MNPSTNPDLSFELRADWLTGYLRADQIRTDTLVQLVSHWADPDARDDIIARLDQLAEIVQGPRREGELDAAVEAVEEAAVMDTARIELTARAARRLMQELGHVASKLCRFNPAGTRIPRQQDGRRSA
jgi:hypothetical protein